MESGAWKVESGEWSVEDVEFPRARAIGGREGAQKTGNVGRREGRKAGRYAGVGGEIGR